MTTYKELFGKYVQNLSSDPTSTDAEGQIWYNTTSGTFKTALGSQGAWASGGNLNTSRSLVGAGIGLQNAALAAGGFSSPVGNYVGSTELYNGTSWTSNPTGMNTARGNGFNCGTQSAAVYGSGYFTSIVNTTELWNGTSWTSNPTGMNTARIYGGRAASATQTAALAFGGEGTPRAVTGATESFNGTSWTSLNSLNTARSSGISGSGTLTAALAFGGFPTTTATESFNGTSWTTVNSLNTGRQYLTGFGLQTAAVAAGGYNPLTSPNYVGTTEQWNGTSWTSNPVGLTTVRSGSGGAGTQTSGLVFGGETGPTTLSSTEVWSRSVVVPVAGSWSSGGNMNTARYSGGSAGTQTAALGFGGQTTSPSSSTESYNGTSWTAVNSLNTARYTLGGVGTQTAALGFAGYTYPPSFYNNTESWNGTSWTTVNAMNTSRSGIGSAGTQTAALGFGGSGPSFSGATESWNGTSWTTLPATMNTARGAMGSTGTQTAALGLVVLLIVIKQNLGMEVLGLILII